MKHLRLALVAFLVFAVASAATLGAATLILNRTGAYSHAPPPKSYIAELPASSYARASAPTLETPPTGKGTVVIDVAHTNSFTENEVTSLLNRITARGFTVDFMGRRNHRDFEPVPQHERKPLLDQKLRQADALLVMLPQNAYTQEEVASLQQFVAQGGRLLLVADPTRHHHINSIANAFGMLVEDDYLYNIKEHESNFKNIFVTRFAADDLTMGLRRVVFYTASSVKADVGLTFTDENTSSSLREGQPVFSTLARTADRRVALLSDFTFMLEPYSSVADNGQLISNLADFLTSGRRTFILSDFPSFFRDSVDILTGNASLFNISVQMKSVLAGLDVPSDLRSVEDFTRDTVFVGLYQDSRQVASPLGVAGIQINESIRTPFASGVPRFGTAIVLLHRELGRNVLIVLSDTRERLSQTVDLLKTGEFRRNLAGDSLALIQLAEPPATPTPTRSAGER